MKIIYGLIYQMDKTMQFLYLFYVSAIIVLIVLHHFLKKHIRLWAGLCCVPLLFFGLFLLKEGYRGDAELTIMRYAAFGILSLLIALWGLAMLLGTLMAFTCLGGALAEDSATAGSFFDNEEINRLIDEFLHLADN